MTIWHELLNVIQNIRSRMRKKKPPIFFNIKIAYIPLQNTTDPYVYMTTKSNKDVLCYENANRIMLYPLWE